MKLEKVDLGLVFGNTPTLSGDDKFTTDEEGDDIDKMLTQMMYVRGIIREKYPESNKFITDTMPCPICKTGICGFMISDHYNGHIHCHCSTKGCVNWME